MTSSGLPTARHHFPPGTPAQVCIDHNRVCKAARIIAKALEWGHGENISDAGIDAAAEAADVREPGSEETREAVRAGLAAPLTNDDSNQYFGEAVMVAAAKGHPFRYTDHQGRTVLMVPLPLGE